MMARSDLRPAYDRLVARIGEASSPDRREGLKRDIIALYKQVDGELGELTRLKDDLRQLVEQFKQRVRQSVAESAPAPADFSGPRPAVRADHIGASTFIEKGWSLISLGDYPGAIQALETALSLSPGEIQAESLLGWAQMLSEQYDAALQTFQAVLAREPTNSLARINLGYICLKKGIFGEAIEHLSKAIRLNNDRKATLYAHYYLGLVYLEREMFEDAQTFFRKTLRLGPNLIEAYHALGRAQWLAGDKDGARETWTQGYQANRFNPWGKRCKELVERVEAGGELPRS